MYVLFYVSFNKGRTSKNVCLEKAPQYFMLKLK